MRVPEGHLSMILSGAVTTMRRPGDPNVQPEGTHRVHRPRGKAVCRITITDAKWEPLDHVDDATARAEGYRDAATYRDEWARFHRVAWTGEHAWTIRFKVEKPKESHHHLAPAGRSGDGRGYLSRPPRQVPEVAHPAETVARIAEATALCDEPESVDPDLVERLPASLEAKQRHQRLRLDQQKAIEALPLPERLALELAAAREAGVDTRVYEESIARRLRALRNRVRRAA